MLAQRRRRCLNIISQLGQCIVLSGSGLSGDKASPVWQSVPMLGQRRIRLNSIEPAARLAQHRTGIGRVGLHYVYEVHLMDAYGDGGKRDRPKR